MLKSSGAVVPDHTMDLQGFYLDLVAAHHSLRPAYITRNDSLREACMDPGMGLCLLYTAQLVRPVGASIAFRK